MKIYATVLILVVCSVSRGTLGFGEVPAEYSDDGCWRERGCFHCGSRENGDACLVGVGWEPNVTEGVVKYNLWGTMTGNTGHVSMGFTTSRDMFNAEVYSCISDGTSQRMVRSWNPSSPARTTEPRNLTGVRDEEVSVVDGEIRCQFYRFFSLDEYDPEFFNISGNASYYLILSRGGLNVEGFVGGHTNSAVSSSVVGTRPGWVDVVFANNATTTMSNGTTTVASNNDNTTMMASTTADGNNVVCSVVYVALSVLAARFF